MKNTPLLLGVGSMSLEPRDRSSHGGNENVEGNHSTTPVRQLERSTFGRIARTVCVVEFRGFELS